MKIIASALVLIGIAVGDCSIQKCYWYNPSRTLEQARQDCQECYNESIKEASEAVSEYYAGRDALTASSSSLGNDIDVSDTGRDALQGWTAWGTTYRVNVFRGCMTERGYHRAGEGQLGQSVRKRTLSIDNIAGR